MFMVHTAFEDLDVLYEQIVQFLRGVSENNERLWDPKTTVEAGGLFVQLVEPRFLVVFQSCRLIFGFTKALSIQLQGTVMDVCRGYKQVSLVRAEVAHVRENAEDEFHRIFEAAQAMAARVFQIVQIDFSPPRTASRQTLRSNVVFTATSPEEYWRRAVFLPFVDCLLSQLTDRFQGRNLAIVQGIKLLPQHLDALTDDDEGGILAAFEDDLPSPASFRQEIRLWRRQWADAAASIITHVGLSEFLAEHQHLQLAYPNVFKIFRLLVIIPATSSSVERANSALRLVKTDRRGSMSDGRLTALVLLHVHRAIPIDIEKLIDKYARKHPRRMTFLNPLDK